jgi:AhpD family alkylhydroperoxidase
MTTFTVHTIESAPDASRPLLEGFQKTFGFVPNLYAVFAESPAALRGVLAIGDAFSKSSLSPAEQQLVALTVSEANDCQFCVAAHSTIAKHIAKADPAVVAAVRERHPIPDAKLDALVTLWKPSR